MNSGVSMDVFGGGADCTARRFELFAVMGSISSSCGLRLLPMIRADIPPLGSPSYGLEISRIAFGSDDGPELAFCAWRS